MVADDDLAVLGLLPVLMAFLFFGGIGILLMAFVTGVVGKWLGGRDGLGSFFLALIPAVAVPVVVLYMFRIFVGYGPGEIEEVRRGILALLVSALLFVLPFKLGSRLPWRRTALGSGLTFGAAGVVWWCLIWGIGEALR